MREVVEITPKQAKKNTKLICSTRKGNSWFHLTETYKILTDDQLHSQEFSNERVMEIPFDDTRRSFRFGFEVNPPASQHVRGSIEDIQQRAARELDENKKRAAFEFFSKHMQIQVAGGDRNEFLIGEPVYVMTFANHRTINSALRSEKKYKVYHKVASMTLQEKLNLTLYYMPSYYGKRHSEIMEAMVDFETGLLMQEAYMNDFLNNYDEKAAGVSMKTYINKATQMGIISKSGDSFVIHGKTHVGFNESDMIQFFTNDPATFNNYIVEQVNKLTKLPEDDLVVKEDNTVKRIMAMAELEKVKQSQSSKNVVDDKSIREKAKNMGIANTGTKAIDRLKEEISQVESGTHPTVKAPQPDPVQK